MNITQKETIKALRLRGESYNNIAEALGISVNTIKSFCRRNNLNDTAINKPEEDSFCRQCNASLKHTPKKKQKVFCSDKCRMRWWNARPEKIRRKAAKQYICITCGRDFTGYGSRERKFCSRACYGKSKAVIK